MTIVSDDGEVVIEWDGVDALVRPRRLVEEGDIVALPMVVVRTTTDGSLTLRPSSPDGRVWAGGGSHIYAKTEHVVRPVADLLAALVDEYKTALACYRRDLSEGTTRPLSIGTMRGKIDELESVINDLKNLLEGIT